MVDLNDLQGKGTSATPSRAVRKEELCGFLDRAIEALPERFGHFLRMYDIDGKSIAEVAGRVGKSAGAVHMLRARAHDRLLLYSKKGDMVNSRALLEEGYRIGRDALGTNHPTVVSITSNLAALFDRLQRHSDAEPMHREALAGARGYLPEGHAYIGLYLSRLGACLLKLEKFEEAEKSLRDGLAILERSPGEENHAKEAQDAMNELQRLKPSIE